MSVNIGAANIAKIRLAEQGSNPASPASGFGYLFVKAGGVFYKDSSGAVTGPFTDTGGGASAFTDLSDVPASYSGQGGNLVAVNVGETALEFVAPSGGGSGGASLLLEYNSTTDEANNVAIGSSGTWTDVIANQTFTVTDANAIVEIVYAANIVITGSYSYASRIMIDSAGTPVTKIIGGGSGLAGFPGGNPAFVDGLSAGAHTVKLQMTANGGGDAAYCRCSSVPEEVLSLRVMQFLK